MNNTKQLSWNKANELADKAVDQAMGFSFTRPKPGQKITCTIEDVRELAQKAAVNALRAAGCLDATDRADAEHNSRMADRAIRQHREWCRTTGNRC